MTSRIFHRIKKNGNISVDIIKGLKSQLSHSILSKNKLNFNQINKVSKYIRNNKLLNKIKKEIITKNTIINKFSRQNIESNLSSKVNSIKKKFFSKLSNKKGKILSNIFDTINHRDNNKNINNLNTNKPKIKKSTQKQFLFLPEFTGDEPLTEVEFISSDKANYQQKENQVEYEINYYLNKKEMIEKLIYLKIPLKNGNIPTDNIVNIRELKETINEENDSDIRSDIEDINEHSRLKEFLTIKPKVEGENKINKNSYFSISEYPGNYVKSSKMDNYLNKRDINHNFDNKNVNESYFGIKSNQDIPNNSSNSQNKYIYNKIQNIHYDLKYNITPLVELKSKEELIFESRFESGNLLCTFRTEEKNKYLLYLQNDTNTTGYTQWFFFRVSNAKKGRRVTFTIINLLRSVCLYKNGLKIMTYSQTQSRKEGIGWHRDCTNVKYYQNNLITYNKKNNKKRYFFSLSFDYEFKYNYDVVYFANCLPSLYSGLYKEINHYEKDSTKSKLFTKKILSKTLLGNDLISINIGNENKNEKKSIILFARQHPGETIGTHTILGCLEFLLGDSDEAKILREIYNFQIIPILNPDGVVVGNSRTSLAGCDLNRRWFNPNEIIHPEIFNTKSLILNMSLNQNISFIIDFHGHFSIYNSLFYYNKKEGNNQYAIFPYICDKLSKIISFQDSIPSMPNYKNSTGRLSLFRELSDKDNKNILCVETSYFYIKDKKTNKSFYLNSSLLKNIGRDICLSILSYTIKFEKINLEKIFLPKKIEELEHNLNVNMETFEQECTKKENETKNELLEESESEPSIDNLDQKEIINLMPVQKKAKKRKIKNSYFNIYNNLISNEHKVKKIEPLIKTSKSTLKRSNCNIKKDKNRDKFDVRVLLSKEFRYKKEKEDRSLIVKVSSNSKFSPLDSNFKFREIKGKSSKTTSFIINGINAYTQTEEIFFKIHWSHFIIKYKILTPQLYINHLPNIATIYNAYSLNQCSKGTNTDSMDKNSKKVFSDFEKMKLIRLSKFGVLSPDNKSKNNKSNTQYKHNQKNNRSDVENRNNVLSPTFLFRSILNKLSFWKNS